MHFPILLNVSYHITGLPFHFRGSGWPVPKVKMWTPAYQMWISAINNLFNSVIGQDFFVYMYNRISCSIQVPPFQYNHAQWEMDYPSVFASLPNKEPKNRPKRGSEAKSKALDASTLSDKTKDSPCQNRMKNQSEGIFFCFHISTIRNRTRMAYCDRRVKN